MCIMNVVPVRNNEKVLWNKISGEKKAEEESEQCGSINWRCLWLALCFSRQDSDKGSVEHRAIEAIKKRIKEVYRVGQTRKTSSDFLRSICDGVWFQLNPIRAASRFPLSSCMSDLLISEKTNSRTNREIPNSFKLLEREALETWIALLDLRFFYDSILPNHHCFFLFGRSTKNSNWNRTKNVNWNCGFRARMILFSSSRQQKETQTCRSIKFLNWQHVLWVVCSGLCTFQVNRKTKYRFLCFAQPAAFLMEANVIWSFNEFDLTWAYQMQTF